ncbi:hypothetical protein XAP412_730008 [Xanthomonas phaseoli pv. phaseoli]|uniref:Uncharacterized protein n=1 Tax=Xanthomonas campestris pv. phaseoli TaxID=317013 RepID=A0AB38E3N5_XANCH|nr:hypothetical protein XAP6984_770008 [Xanthomonas phaseoli pv. phaseoli]SON89481.1 hypothetical protein XAP412_730008 [Xanthomonas phaseoli pv. phaseoli]SON92187.1 hypothetical protein XAP7430_730008 [Xanthomonas phaseoli pv. phaseoli]SOO29041.1 hypothetical protein XAP6164_3020024 [Xanthomonas phaseoli pv. phaseoli]
MLMRDVHPFRRPSIALILAANARHQRHLHWCLRFGFDQAVWLDHPARGQAILQTGVGRRRPRIPCRTAADSSGPV